MKTILRVISATLIGTAIVLQVLAYSHEMRNMAMSVRQHFDGSYEVHHR